MQTTCTHAHHENIQQQVRTILDYHKPGLLALLPVLQENMYAALKRVADKGVAHAKYYVALCMRYGLGTKQDLHWSLVNLLEAAGNKHPYALYELSLCYLYGIGTVPNRVVAYSFCVEACHKNLARARSLLAYLKQYKEPSFEEDQAARAFVHASLDFSMGFCTIGDAYFCGSGMHQDDELAVEYYSIASHLNDASALTSLGFCHLNGRGVEQANASTAMMYYYEAAIRGHTTAQHTLAVAYKRGIGVFKSKETSKRWLELAIHHEYASK